MSVVKPFNIPSISPESNQLISNSVGKIVEVTDDGIAYVDFPENTAGPVPARSILSGNDKVEGISQSAEVLLVFEQSDPLKPIITGIINEQLFTQCLQKVKNGEVKEQCIVDVSRTENLTDATIDGKKVTFNAKDEILLRCGKSSILLRKDGKIVIKGSNLVSRSSASNKIKGSSVSIN